MHIRQPCFALLLLTLLTLLITQAPISPSARAQQPVAPTYTIFATREGLVGHMTANGHIIRERDRFVALPSWKVLSSYQGSEYQVRLTYKGRSVIAPVWDVGPWNVNDEYWLPNRPTYSDLPMGMPMAQAAYLNGYNGGRDQYGRRITNPNGIDIADGTFWDDLGMTSNDWVQVSFLWLGSDPGPGAASEIVPPLQLSLPVPAAPAPLPTSTPYPLDSPVIASGSIAVDNYSIHFHSGATRWYKHPCGVNGSHTWTYSRSTWLTSEVHAAWTPFLTTPGVYEVRAYVPPCGELPATHAAHYSVEDDYGEVDVIIDQAAAGGKWVSLGVYAFARTTTPTVKLRVVADDDGSAIRFDTIEWVYLPDVPLPDIPSLDALRHEETTDRAEETMTVRGEETMTRSGEETVTRKDPVVQNRVRHLLDDIWRALQTTTKHIRDWLGTGEKY